MIRMLALYSFLFLLDSAQISSLTTIAESPETSTLNENRTQSIEITISTENDFSPTSNLATDQFSTKKFFISSDSHISTTTPDMKTALPTTLSTEIDSVSNQVTNFSSTLSPDLTTDQFSTKKFFKSSNSHISTTTPGMKPTTTKTTEPATIQTMTQTTTNKTKPITQKKVARTTAAKIACDKFDVDCIYRPSVQAVLKKLYRCKNYRFLVYFLYHIYRGKGCFRIYSPFFFAKPMSEQQKKCCIHITCWIKKIYSYRSPTITSRKRKLSTNRYKKRRRNRGRKRRRRVIFMLRYRGR